MISPKSTGLRPSCEEIVVEMDIDSEEASREVDLEVPAAKINASPNLLVEGSKVPGSFLMK